MKQWQPFTDNELTKDVSENRCGGRRNIFFLLLFTDQLSTEYLETTLNENENEIKLSTLAVKQTLQVRGEKGLNRLMIFKINLKVIAEQKNYYNGFTLATFSINRKFTQVLMENFSCLHGAYLTHFTA